jgi:DNA replication protein DnaC
MNASFDEAFNRSKGYCVAYRQMLEKGQGMYIYGGFGVGKTLLTACVANELLTNCQQVIFTNLFEISKAIKSTFHRNSEETEQSIFGRFADVQFLILDDIGSEIFAKKDEETWLQGLLFDLINRRYNELKPTIFTSNFSLRELIEIRGISEKTVSRIFEMSRNFVLKIGGTSRR